MNISLCCTVAIFRRSMDRVALSVKDAKCGKAAAEVAQLRGPYILTAPKHVPKYMLGTR